jgi:hypothetical protein
LIAVSTIIGQRTETPMPCGADDGELRRAVDAEPLHADEPGHRRRVHDVPAGLLGEEPRDERLDAVHDTPEVDAHRVLPVGVRRLRDLAEERDAGVVADDVHAAEAADGLVGEGLDRGAVADVGADGVHGRAVARELGGGAGERRVVHVGEHEPRPPGGEGARHRHADAARSARDHGHASVECVHRRRLHRASRRAQSRLDTRAPPVYVRAP